MPSANTPSTNQTQPTPAPAGMDSAAFFDQIGQQLINQSGIISSSSSQLEGNINRAISGVRRSAESSNQAIESQFGRERGYLLEGANDSMISGRAAGSGGLLNLAALRELTQTTDKQLSDLAQRKQELILQNDAGAASKIADLELKAIEYRQQAQQSVFNNLLGIGNFGQGVAQENRLTKAQNFSERQAVSNIGLEFGIAVGPNDTLETITAKAAPFASKQRQAELARTLAETTKLNAEINRIAKEGADADTVNNTDLDVLANAYLKNPDIIGNDVSSARFAQIVNRAAQLEDEGLRDEINFEIAENGKSKDEVITSIKSDTTLTAKEKADALKYIESNYPTLEKVRKEQGTGNGAAAFTGSLYNAGGSIASGLTLGALKRDYIYNFQTGKLERNPKKK